LGPEVVEVEVEVEEPADAIELAWAGEMDAVADEEFAEPERISSPTASGFASMKAMVGPATV
jgi:hypothetical protein